MSGRWRARVLLACALSGCAATSGGEAPAEPARPVAVVEAAPLVVEAAPPPEAAPPLEDDMLRWLRPPPEGFVNLREALPGARFEIRYHSPDNFTGAPVPGYGAPGAWLREEVAAALVEVQARLAPQGYGLHVYDAYRPYRATRAFVAWATRTDQVALLDNGYIARRSGHNRGDTLDLSLYALQTGELVDMGTLWDVLDERSHTLRAAGQVLANRLVLRDAMKAAGFHPYSKEWWHFSFELPGAQHRDVPYGCYEPDEGAWAPPTGWDTPGWEAPARWTPPVEPPTACVDPSAAP